MPLAEVQLPYGLATDGRMVPVVEVERGIACACRCPQCGRALVAKKGDIVRHHFAHAADTACIGAFETMTHRLAKQIIAEAGWVYLPALTAFDPHGHIFEAVKPAARTELADISIEVWLAGIRPDILATIEDVRTLVEIRVSHACTREKLDTIADRQLAAFEIDLSALAREWPDMENDLHDLVLITAPRVWLFHPHQAREDARVSGLYDNYASLMEHWLRQHEHTKSMTADLRQTQMDTTLLQGQFFALIRELQYELHVARTEMARAEAKQKKRDSAEQKYLIERYHYERSAILTLGLNEASVWATRERFIAIALGEGPIMRWGHPASGWREALDSEAERQGKRYAIEAEARETVANWRKRLNDAAIRQFRSEERATLWMRSIHPKLGRKRPTNLSIDEPGYQRCLAILQGKAP